MAIWQSTARIIKDHSLDWLCGIFGRKHVKIHALSEGVFAVHFVDFSLRMHIEIVTHVLFGNLAIALIHY